MRRMLLTIGAFSIVACGGDSSTRPDFMNAVGTFQLQTVNGSALPYTVFVLPTPPVKLELLSDVIVVRSDGTYTQTFATSQTQGTTVTRDTRAVSGKWEQRDGPITFTPAGGPAGGIPGGLPGAVAQGVVTGDTLTITVTGAVFVYRRQ